MQVAGTTLTHRHIYIHILMSGSVVQADRGEPKHEIAGLPRLWLLVFFIKTAIAVGVSSAVAMK